MGYYMNAWFVALNNKEKSLQYETNTGPFGNIDFGFRNPL